MRDPLRTGRSRPCDFRERFTTSELRASQQALLVQELTGRLLRRFPPSASLPALRVSARGTVWLSPYRALSGAAIEKPTAKTPSALEQQLRSTLGEQIARRIPNRLVADGTIHYIRR